jgi:hypothetical protein
MDAPITRRYFPMLAQPSLSPQAQTDIAGIEEAEIDYLSGLSSEERRRDWRG